MDDDLLLGSDPVEEALTSARAILRAWGKIHRGLEATLITAVMDATLEFIATEWPTWVEASMGAGEQYISTSLQFAEDARSAPEDAALRAANETWELASKTFDQIFLRRWQEAIFIHAHRALHNTRGRLREQLREELLKKVQPPTEPPKRRHKLRRKKRAIGS